MSLTQQANANKLLLDQANPSALATLLQRAKLGTILRALPVRLWQAKPVANPYDLATNQAFVLPDDCKAASIVAAYGRVGGVTAGPLTIAAYSASAPHPATGEISVSPNGNVVLLAADAWTQVDVLYIPEKLDVVELTVPVVTNAIDLTKIPQVVATINGSANQSLVHLLMEAEITVGTVTGKCIIDPPEASVATSQHAGLNLAKSSVQFKASDAATTARVKLGFTPAFDLNAFLEAVGVDL